MRNKSDNKSYIKFENKIIQSFIELFKEKGENHISVNDIMKKAGVGRATFYQHFKSIDDVYNGVAKWVADIFNSKFYAGHSGSTIANVEKAYAELFSFMAKNENFTYALAYNKQFNKIVSFVGAHVFNNYIKNVGKITTPLHVVQLNCYASSAGVLNVAAAKIRGEIKCSWKELTKWCVDNVKKQYPNMLKRMIK